MRLMKALLGISLIIFALMPVSGEQLNEQIVVGGKPPITMAAVHCHMRLIELVLNTRLTQAQKDSFLEAIKNECAQMPEADRQNFLSALELADSMEQMEPAGHQAVKFVLEKDFEDTAKSLPDDPAAVLYLKVKAQRETPEIKINDQIISRQSFAALVEYVEFIADPQRRVSLSPDSIRSLKTLLEQSYNKLDENEQAVLDDFEMTWHMIRAGWQNTRDQAKKTAAIRQMQAVSIKENFTFDLKTLKACLSPDIYGDLLDEAAQLGFEPGEWSIGQNHYVW